MAVVGLPIPGGTLTEPTFSALARYIAEHPDVNPIVVSPEEWDLLHDFCGPGRVVAATTDRPPFFWFRDKKIVTPAYVEATACRCQPTAWGMQCPWGRCLANRDAIA